VTGAASEPLKTASVCNSDTCGTAEQSGSVRCTGHRPHSCLHLAPAATFALVPVYCRKHAAHDSCKTAEQAIRFSQQLR